MARKQQEKINSFAKLGETLGVQPTLPPDTVEFLGREEEMKEIAKFLASDKCVLEVSGVPMIGKSALVRQYCYLNGLNPLCITFQQAPYTPIQDLEKQLFGGKAWGDFSNIEHGTLLIIENFEQALSWIPNDDRLHRIKYKEIHEIVEGAIQAGVKLMLESRFSAKFEAMHERFVKRLPLKGIDTELFWNLYKEKDFDEDNFKALCKRFDNHTGLLALAYRDVDWLLDGDLLMALEQPVVVSSELWRFISKIVRKLDRNEQYILSALTLWQRTVADEELKSALAPLNINNLDGYIFSLRKKLLIQAQTPNLRYSLNPYLAEVFYTFMQDEAQYKGIFTKVQALPAFQQTPLPAYDSIKRDIDNNNFVSLFSKVKELRRQKQFELALEYLYYALNNPIVRQEVILNEIGITYKWAGKIEEAKKAFEKGIQGGNIQSYNELAIIYREEKQLDKAKELLTKAISLGNIPSYTELAIIYRGEKQLDKALEILEEARKIEPKNIRILNELGITYRDDKQLDKALEILEEARKTEPKNVRILNELSITYRDNNQLDKAKEVLEEARKIEPQNVRILNELGITYRDDNQIDKAKEVLEEARKIEPKNVRVLNELGITYRENKQFDKAKEVLEEAHEIDKKDVRILNELARTHLQAKEYAQALQVVEKGLSIAPKDTYLQNTKKAILQAQAAGKETIGAVAGKALEYLAKANIAEYFEEMDKIEDKMESQQQSSYNKLKNDFVDGVNNTDYRGRLKIFAKQFANIQDEI